MKLSIRKGFSFGLTSGIITTLGLIVGLNSSTQSDIAVIGGIFVIAIADSMSDSLGIHISEESEKERSSLEVWEATFATFFSKLVFALTFAIPVLLCPLQTAIIISVIWGFLLLSLFSYHIAKIQKSNPMKVIGEHVIIGIIVIVITNYIGIWISTL
jgi:VIT1/CCC1 family predicted Fe2+/Mn2+ transporter